MSDEDASDALSLNLSIDEARRDLAQEVVDQILAGEPLPTSVRALASRLQTLRRERWALVHPPTAEPRSIEP